MDLTLFDFRRLLTPPVVVEPAQVELPQEWIDFEKTLLKFKNEYYKNKGELNRFLTLISKNKDELNVIKYAINNIQTNETAEMLREIYNKKATDVNIEELTEEAAIIAGECTNIDNFNKFTCSICTENLIDTFVDPCGHVFCERCISRTVNKTNCPGCRTIINGIKRIYPL
jgi:Zinc finger, C3HC4 type (RING finger)